MKFVKKYLQTVAVLGKYSRNIFRDNSFRISDGTSSAFEGYGVPRIYYVSNVS